MIEPLMRLDQLLVSLGLTPSRTLAQKLIKGNCVEVFLDNKWQVISRSSFQFDSNTEIRILQNELQKFVSRAGLKLEAALAHTNFSVDNLSVLDVGQSTGGFTDCLLQLGATRVIGVDVGHDQLHSSLREDKRVFYFEGVNARAMVANEKLKQSISAVSLVVMDLSFISQTLVLPQLPLLLSHSFSLISLVKPQFEVGKEGIGKGGLVKNKALFSDVEQGICAALSDLGFTVLDYFESPLKGGDGNKEFFVYAQKQ